MRVRIGSSEGVGCVHSAVYPGTFDPITLGHLDIVQRAAHLFDKVVVAILHNPTKQPLFSLDERIRLAQMSVANTPHVEVDTFSGLLVDYYQQHDFQAVVRGVRNHTDFDVEIQMSYMNESLHPALHTVFLPTRPDLSFISSSLVKDVALHSGSVTHLVTPSVEEALVARCTNNTANREG